MDKDMLIKHGWVNLKVIQCERCNEDMTVGKECGDGICARCVQDANAGRARPLGRI